MRKDVTQRVVRPADGNIVSGGGDSLPIDGDNVDLALFAGVLDNLTQGIAVFDRELRLKLFNRRYIKLFKFPADFLKAGMGYEDILRFNVSRGEHGDVDPEMHVQKWLNVARNQTRTSRHEHVRPDGTVIALRRALMPNGGFINTYTDITQRKKAEEKAEHTAMILQTTIDNMADGVRVFDKDLRLMAWNRQAFDMFGFPEEFAAVGTPYSAFLDFTIGRGDYKKETETLESRLARAQHPTVRNTEQEISTGRIIEKRRAPMPDGGFVSTYFDVTERKHAQEALAQQTKDLALASEELKRSNEELQQFAYVASHDLQEPLRMVGSYCQLLQRRYQGKLGQDADEFIGFAVEGAKRMQQLINDLLLYSRVGTKGKAFAATSLEQVFANTLLNLTVAIEETKAEITHDPLPTVDGDGIQLTQLMQNLLGNALKFRDQPPTRIHVGAERDGAMWRIRVQDNGIGIEPQYAERIFMIFQRLHTRQEYPGTGIGLSVCKKIVERHGGRIWVEPAPTKGSIFTFTLAPSGDTP